MSYYLASLSSAEINLPFELNDFISAGFIEEAGAIFFEPLFTNQVATNLRNNSFFDISGFEYTNNKIHLEDYCPQGTVFFSAFKFLNNFERLWLKKFSNRRCIAVVIFQVDEAFGDIAIFTFYLDRLGEAVIDLEKINEFKEPIFIKMIN